MRESRDINNLYYPIKSINEYIYFFNNKRPAYSLNYMTPIQYKNLYAK